PPTAPGATVQYTCPMHPEVVSDRPGSCPKCGMALEPRTALPEEGPNHELIDMSRRFGIGLALTVPLLILHMGHVHGFEWLQLALATPVVFACGWPLLERGVMSLVYRSLNMFTLIGLGVGVAYFFSVAAMLWPHIFGKDLYFESAAS